MTSIGRNDICSCGSGKKYKKCCFLQIVQKFEPSDSDWIELRKTEGTVIETHLMPYVLNEFPKDIFDAALEEFLPFDDLPDQIDMESFFEPFFIPWFLFNWIPAENFGVAAFDPMSTIAQNYLKKHVKKLTGLEKRFIQAMNKTYYSFYGILEVHFEKSIVMKDLLLGSLHTTKERQGTHYVKRGDIILSRILTLNNQSISIGMAPIIVPASYHTKLIDFKETLLQENNNQPLTPALLRDEFDFEICDYFFEVINDEYNKQLPTLLNTDNELIQFSKTYFKLNLSPEETLVRLLPITLSKDPLEFLQEATRNKSGEIKKLEFPWLKKGNKKLKELNNTLMGRISITDNRLILETNSERRTEKAKKLFHKYLGESIQFQKTLIQTPEQVIRSQEKSTSQNKNIEHPIETFEDLEQIPLIAKAHWEHWFDQSIPALNNQSPRQAAMTPKGKEYLEALFLQYERYDLDRELNDPMKANIPYLKAMLDLS